MTYSIDLDRQSSRFAIEVQDIRFDGALPPEGVAVESPSLEGRPERHFGRGQ
jgi:hypothetical protein